MRNLAAAAICAMLLSACGGNSGPTATVPPPPDPPAGYQQPGASICDASLALSSGLLCAIAPSRLDAGSRDVYSNGTLADLRLGFGYHAIAFPPTGTDIKGVYIHLTGSYGRPYNQNTDDFGSGTFLEESLSSGYIVIQLAYNNRFSINFDECGADAATLSIDNCSGDVRMEKIVGVDLSAVTDTPLEDSIEFRLMKIVTYLESENVSFPFEIVSSGVVNWQLLRVGGHSQGATHALYLGKYFFASSVCILAGGYDIPDTVPSVPAENMADWLLDDSVILDIDKVRAVTAVDDDNYNSFIRAYVQLGMIKDIHYREFSGAPYFDASGGATSGHGAAIADPRYAGLRAEACFSDL